MRSLISIAIAIAALMITPANAATTVLDATVGGSTANAPAGPLATIGIGDTLRINFSSPFAANNDAVLQVAFGTPGIQFSISAGQTVAGTNTTVFQQTNLDSSRHSIYLTCLAKGVLADVIS